MGEVYVRVRPKVPPDAEVFVGGWDEGGLSRVCSCASGLRYGGSILWGSFPADAGAVAPARLDVLVLTEYWMTGTVLLAPGWRECPGLLSETGRDGTLGCRRYVTLEQLWCQVKQL